MSSASPTHGAQVFALRPADVAGASHRRLDAERARSFAGGHERQVSGRDLESEQGSGPCDATDADGNARGGSERSVGAEAEPAGSWSLGEPELRCQSAEEDAGSHAKVGHRALAD
jgi:hypothetical protein